MGTPWINQFANLGIQIVIGDFCSGHTSFVYLTNLPVSEIRIDKSFTMNMIEDPKKLQIVSSIIALAQSLELHD